MSDDTTTRNSGPFATAVRRAFRQPAFVAAAAVLLLAAVSLNGATQFLQLHFKKLPVAMARPFTALPQRMGNWVLVSEDDKLDKEMQDVLGTDKYLYRDYVDFRVFSPETIARFNGKTGADRKRMVQELEQLHPEGVINVGLTYYTGLVDTVAHIPDRCYIADGYEPRSYTTPTWKLSGGRSIDVRYINFEDQSGTARVPKNVAYFFHVNGHYESDPLAVRQRLQNLFEKYGYYAKIELMTIDPRTDESAAAMTDFLGAALPEIEKSFPDWDRAGGGK